MDEPPRPRRGRSRRRQQPRPRPTQAPAEPLQPPASRERPPRETRRPDQRGPQQRRGDRGRPERGRGERAVGPPRERGERRVGKARRGRGRPQPAEQRTGTPAVILLDNREGEPDLTGQVAVFEGYFDPETGERRRGGDGIPRLKVDRERIWGFECWWRADPSGAGLTPEDHAQIETAKRLLRGLIRDARRPPAFARRPSAS